VGDTYVRGLVQTTSFGAVKGVQLEGTLVWEGISYGKTPEGKLR
jgi:carboxylesterase type B